MHNNLDKTLAIGILYVSQIVKITLETIVNLRIIVSDKNLNITTIPRLSSMDQYNKILIKPSHDWYEAMSKYDTYRRI